MEKPHSLSFVPFPFTLPCVLLDSGRWPIALHQQTPDVTVGQPFEVPRFIAHQPILSGLPTVSTIFSVNPMSKH